MVKHIKKIIKEKQKKLEDQLYDNKYVDCLDKEIEKEILFSKELYEKFKQDFNNYLSFYEQINDYLENCIQYTEKEKFLFCFYSTNTLFLNYIKNKKGGKI